MIRAFLAFEAATFILAALVHAGILTNADPHAAAATGESVIAIALVIGLALTWTGLTSVATDIAYHVAVSVVLLVGVVVASRRLA